MIQSLRSRLVLSTLLISLIGFAVVVVVFTRQLTPLSERAKSEELRRQSERLATQVHDVYRGNGTFQQLTQRIQLASQLLNERILIYSPQDKIKLQSSAAGLHPDIHACPEPAAFRQRVARVTYIHNDLVCFQNPVRGTHGHLNGGTVVLLAKSADLRPPFNALLGVILATAGTALLVWLVTGLYVTSAFFQPLLRITQATRRMARGDYGVRVHPRGQREMEQLARSFNDMAQQVQSSNQTQRDFLANVSHDLRTPLTMIAGFSGAMLDGTAGEADAYASAQVIHEEALKMQRLVDDLLQLTRLESGLLTLERHPIDVRPFAQRVIDRALHARGRSHVLTIHNQVSVDCPRIMADPDRLERALGNLLDNAVEYTPDGGTITVTARGVERAWVEIGVSDTGRGIPAADVDRVFERFYRADPSRERTHGHSGLGLAIVREIVEAHGGRAWAESDSSGSTFRVMVPQAPKDAVVSQQQRPESATEVPT